MEITVVGTGEGDGEAVAEITVEIYFQEDQATIAPTFSAEITTRLHTTAIAIILGTITIAIAGEATEAIFFQEEITVEIVEIAYLAIATTTLRGTFFQGATTTQGITFLETIITIQETIFLETIITGAIFSATTITTIISLAIITTEAAISSAIIIIIQEEISLTTTITQIKP